MDRSGSGINLTAMTSYLHTILSAAAILLTPAFVSLHAQDNLEPEHKMAAMTLREDKVGADLTTLASRKSAAVYDRRVVLSNNGAYNVLISDAAGNVRMEGSYLDMDLTVADGEFTYYYPNGNVESKGNYANGRKTGVWHRYNADGSARAERIYTGMTWEELAVSLGIHSVAGRN
jgi:hypothetical protein